MTLLIKPAPLVATLVAIALAAAPAGAQTTDGAEQPTAHEVEPAPEVNYDAASTVATIDGTEIKLGELISLRANLPEQYQALPDEVLSDGLLDQLIDQTLLEKAAREAELDQDPVISLTLRNQIRAVLAEAYLSAEVERRMTDELIQAAYDEAYGGDEPVEEVNAAHILVETEEQAKALKAELDGGADFAALAAQHGTDGTASRGGALGWFVYGDMVPEFADAAFALEAGQISDPVQSPFGWHLIKLEDRRPREAPPLEQVRGEIASQLTQSLQQTVLTELREGVSVEMADPPVPPEAIRADGLLATGE